MKFIKKLFLFIIIISILSGIAYFLIQQHGGGIIFLYDKGPDVTGFISQQQTKLTITSQDNSQELEKAETTLTTKNLEKEKVLQLRKNQESQKLLIDENITNITFSSKPGIHTTQAHLILPQGNIITLYPQTAIEIQKSPLIRGEEGGFVVNIIQGRIKLYVPELASGSFVTTGYLTGIELHTTENIQNIIDQYESEKHKYLIKQIGGEYMLNASLDGFIKRYLNIANSISHSFDQNILNYYEFHTILDYQTKNTYANNKEIQQKILNKTNEGIGNTKLKQRRDSFTKLFTTKK